ncbi:MAG: class I fructose-bisphosphate aldolase [Deltaproteobacteria bacterium]|nr:class I fructose-bisphosphate aldolase [Deltaproteobacteria bacterium]
MIEKFFELQETQDLLNYQSTIISKELIFRWKNAEDRMLTAMEGSLSQPCLNNLARIFYSGALKGTGYITILAVDQGVEHSGLFSFCNNPRMFDPIYVTELAIEAGFSALASSVGIMSKVSRKFSHRIPLILKINHNELLSVPTRWEQTMFAVVKQAWDMGCAGIGFTVYFGSETSRVEIEKAKDVIATARDLGLVTFCWCYPRNKFFRFQSSNIEEADDITSQAIYLGSTLGVEFVKQKLPKISGGFKLLKSQGFEVKYSDGMANYYSEHPIDMVRLQVLHANAGRTGVLNSGGESLGQNDEKDLFLTALINKRGGGTGLMVGRKIFKKSFEESLNLSRMLHDVYLDSRIKVA